MRRVMLVLTVLVGCGDDGKTGAGADSGELDVSFGGDGLAEAVDTATPEIAADTVAETVAETAAETIAETIAETVADTTPVDVADTDSGPGSDVVQPVCVTLAAGHARHVVVSYPFSEPDGEGSPRWRVFRLGPDGAPGVETAAFDLSRAFSGEVAFRPDGAVAVTVHDDGTIGVFTLDGAGGATVLETNLDVGAYATEVQFAGDRLLIVDPNWQDNGGGIYAAPLGCDGAVGPATLLYPTKNAASLVLRGDRHLVAAVEAVTTEPGSLHLVGLSGGGSWTRVIGADLFPDDVDIISSLAVTSDGRFALVGDNQFFESAVDNRVGVARIEGDSMKAYDVVSPLYDPVAIVPSPYDDAVLVVLGYDNAVRVLAYDADADPAVVDLGEPDYIDAPPQLPGSAAIVGGAFPDQVLVVENVALRRFRFDSGGVVTDLGLVLEGDGYDSIPGALGVQP